MARPPSYGRALAIEDHVRVVAELLRAARGVGRVGVALRRGGAHAEDDPHRVLFRQRRELRDLGAVDVTARAGSRHSWLLRALRTQQERRRGFAAENAEAA